MEVSAKTKNSDKGWREAKPEFLDRMKFLCMKDEMADIYFVFNRQQQKIDEQTVKWQDKNNIYFEKFGNNSDL